MKKLSKILLLTLLLALSVLMIASCTKPDADIDVSVKEDALPQLQYVAGKDLDLSAGVLLVTENGTTTEIPMNSPDVTVTGYDKDKVGEQTITLQYKEKTLTLNVTVVSRMVALEYTADYLVGDSFDNSKGRLKITRDDGTTYTVPLSNASVTIEGFNSSSATTDLALTARYSVNGDEYTAGFSVSVYAVESVDIHRPNKVSYNSHEGGLDVAGGYLTLKGNGGKLTKDVTITADMVSGFDLSAVNETNTPLTQTLTVTYDGNTYNYDVKLVYTDISLFNKNAAKYTSIVWTGTTLPTITEADGKLALEMMELYLDMTKAEKSYVSTSDALNVARAAMAYGYVKWNAELAKYESVFEMTATGAVSLVCESYTAVDDSIDALASADNVLYTMAPTLIKLSEEFSSESLITNVKFADCVVIEPSAIRNTVAELQFMTALYEKFAEIDDDWANQNIMTFETKIKSIYTFITESVYGDSAASQLYMLVSSWRTNDDAFDILYAYYFEKNDMDSITTLAGLRLPGELQDLFNSIAGAFNQISQLSALGVFDTSGFFYYYYKAVELSENVKTSNNAIIKELYNTLPLNGLLGMTDNSVQYKFDTLLEYFRTANGGSFQYYSASLLGVEAYNELLELYIKTLTKLLDEPGYEKSVEYDNAIKSIFNKYAALTPTQQLNFLSVLNAYYNYGYPPFAFDDQGDYAYMVSLFNQLVNQHIREKLSAITGASAAYDNLVLAMEIYAQRASYENWLAEFTTRMDSVISTFNGMSAADKAIFNAYLESAYVKYSDIRTRYNTGSTATDLGDWKDAFDALEEAIVNIDNAYYLLEQGYPVYNLLYNAYERAEAIVANILSGAPDAVKKAYYYDALYVVPSDTTGDSDLYYTYDYMLNLYRGIYVDCMCGFFAGSDNYFDAYNNLGLGEFLNKTYDITWTFAWKYAFATESSLVFDRADSVSVMEAFRALDRDSQVLFIVMEGDYGLYYESVVKFIAETYLQDAASVAYKMVELEQLMLVSDPEDAAALASIEASLAALETLYTALSGDAQADFADLENVYADIVNDCRAMLAGAN